MSNASTQTRAQSKESQTPDILSDSAQRHLTRTILMLAWPAILEQFLICMASLADTAMVGSIGASATAAVAVNISSIWLINGFITALSVGFSYLISHTVGAGDPVHARRITAQALLCSAVLGITLSLAVELICHPLPIWLGADPEVIPQAQRYMQIIGFGLTAQAMCVTISAVFRSAGNTRIPLTANLTANVANIIGNFFLIYPTRTITIGGTSFSIWGAGLGVAGAGTSTALSQCLLLLILLAFLTFGKTPIQLNLLHADFRVERQTLAQLWQISVPVLLERLTLTSGQIALTAMISGLGTISLAAHYLTNQTEGILYLPAYGFAYTATALVGQALGAHRTDLADRFAVRISWIGSIVIVLACVPVALFSGPIIHLFSPDPDVVALGTRTLFVAATTEIFFSFTVIAGGIFRASGDVRFALLVSIIGMWGLRIGLVWFAIHQLGLGVVGVWLAIAVDCLIRMILCIWRIKSKKWRRNQN